MLEKEKCTEKAVNHTLQITESLVLSLCSTFVPCPWCDIVICAEKSSSPYNINIAMVTPKRNLHMVGLNVLINFVNIPRKLAGLHTAKHQIVF